MITRLSSKCLLRPSDFKPSQDDLEVIGVQLFEDFPWVREIRRMPSELSVVSVPTRRREISAKIDQRVARQFLLAEDAGDPFDFFGTAQCSVRLQIA